MLRTFIQVTTVIIVVISAFFLVRGIAFLSPQDLAELSKLKFQFDLNVARNLIYQRSDTIVGFSLLLLSFLLQMINLLWPMRIGDFAVNKKGVILALIVSTLLFMGSLATSDTLSRYTYKEVKGILLTK